MARIVFIVQGEGRGHMSQSVALKEHLEEAGHTIEAVFAGVNPRHQPPGYFLGLFGQKLENFASPYFLRTPNKKGIYVGLTILYNLLRSARYLREVYKIRKRITSIAPDVVINFYDVVGALALRKIEKKIKRVGIGHHFFLHLEGYNCGGGNPLHRLFLKMHTRIVMGACDCVLALSYREVQGEGKISVVPPLIRRTFRESEYRSGDRYLVYLLNEGFITELAGLAENDPGFKADLFSGLPSGTRVPGGIQLHPVDDRLFLDKMKTCKGLITTAGFDTVAEAAYMGIPTGVFPVRHHFEQRCNSRDVVKSGLGILLKNFSEAQIEQLAPPRSSAYRSWADRAGEMIINHVQG